MSVVTGYCRRCQKELLLGEGRRVPHYGGAFCGPCHQAIVDCIMEWERWLPGKPLPLVVDGVIFTDSMMNCIIRCINYSLGGGVIH